MFSNFFATWCFVLNSVPSDWFSFLLTVILSMVVSEPLIFEGDFSSTCI